MHRNLFDRTSAAALVGCLAVVAGTTLPLATTESVDAGVRWRSGAEPAVAKMDNVSLREAVERFAGVEDARAGADGDVRPRHFVATFERPLEDFEKEALARAGISLLNYLNDHSFFASADAEHLDAEFVGNFAALRNVRSIERNWKLHADLVAGVIQPWSIVGAEKPGAEGAANPTVALYVMLHQDVDVDTEGPRLVAKHGGSIVSMIGLTGVNGMVIELPWDHLKEFADDDRVMYVEPPLPQWDELNSENRAITGANIAQAAPYNLTGAGVRVFVYDGGQARITHVDFQGRASILPGDTSTANSNHATHVSGTIGGGGVANPLHKGMAPGVAIVSAGFQWGGGNGFLYTDPGDMVMDFTEAIVNQNVHISNASIGNNTESNGYPCDRQGDYGFTDTVIDSIARGSINGQPFRLVWAAGNERQGSRCDVEGFGDYYSSAPPAMAKNHITVGALNSNNDSMTTFSSWGPADDGRMRPDLSGPGCQQGGDNGVTSCSNATSNSGYAVLCGTSMSSPTVCGLSALLIEDHRTQFPSQPDMRGSTLKALLMHTCEDVLNPGPDYQTGYGSVRIVRAIDQMRSGHFFEAEVSQGGVYTATVVVQPSDTQLRVTIAWDDPPGTPNVNPTLVNDLDLLVIGPGGTQFFPWTLDPLNPSANAVRTQRNFRDNNEQVLIDNPVAGAYLVEVRGFNVPQGPQPFSLVASPFLVNCSSQGVASLDRQTYHCSSLAGLRVVDCDLNTSDAVIDTVMVHIASTTDSGFSLVLTEVAPEAATFTGTVQLSTSMGGASLQVSHGDTITLTYMDADDGTGMPATVTATASVDCQGPVISGVNVPPATLQATSARVEFTTDEPATALVRFGTSCGSLTGTASTNTLNTSHSVLLTGLMRNTAYFFEVEATDSSGNSTTSNNGGACFTFMTPDIPDYFTELFSAGDNDIDFVQFTFTPDGSFQHYTVCRTPITELPTNPANGTSVNLPDDSPSTLLTLTGGQTVKLYGVAYPQVYLNPNGHLTFLASSSTLTESLANHFNVPRVSAMFDDLGPHQGGTVTWQQINDQGPDNRLVISYVNVREFNTTNTVTFQYELFFDGRIRLSYLNIGITDGLIGLSRGGGVPADFIESDYSSYGACGPRPPVASGASVQTPVGGLIPITLLATDDGLPSPPAALRYIIQSLPLHGRLFDPNSGPIQNAPYELVGNGNIVEYEPFCTYLGGDSFTYVANDYGEAPEGGDSNSAGVSIAVGGPTTIYEFLVDDMNPGWTMDAGWAFGQPTGGGGAPGGGSGNPDPTGGFTGQNVLGFNLSGNYTNNMPQRNLTSTAIDCSAYTGVRVEFQRWLGVEASQFDQASFQASNNGSSWTTIWQHSGASLNPTGWTLHSYDISAVADGQATVYLRWTLGPTDVSVVYCGWNIDDIRIKADVQPPPCPNDYNGDCEVSFGDIAFILANWPPFTFNDISIVLGAWGQSCD